MNKIASFCVDHTKLDPGVYISRIDGDITTYDLRLKKPNSNDFLENSTLHTIEHIFATICRNSEYSKDIIYFGPMGCRTGFYFLVRNMNEEDVLNLIVSTLKKISEFIGEIPGNSEVECGNYLEHDLEGARKESEKFYNVIKSWDSSKMIYKN